MGTFTQYAIAAARQALEDAEWKPEDDIGKERTVSIQLNVNVSSLYLFYQGCLHWIRNGKLWRYRINIRIL